MRSFNQNLCSVVTEVTEICILASIYPGTLFTMFRAVQTDKNLFVNEITWGQEGIHVRLENRAFGYFSGGFKEFDSYINFHRSGSMRRSVKA